MVKAEKEKKCCLFKFVLIDPCLARVSINLFIYLFIFSREGGGIAIVIFAAIL